MNRLGMTEEQMITEIECMRKFEKFLIQALGEEHYTLLCQAHAKEESVEALKRLGASAEEIEKIATQVDAELGWGTQKH